MEKKRYSKVWLIMANLEYVACIMCGKTVIANKFNAEPFTIDPLDYIVLQIREQRGGKSKQEGQQPGFFLLKEDSKTIRQLWESGDPQERAVAETFKDRILSIVRAYKQAGIIKREELE